jgi:predicted RNase H-like HicB family nuclease
VPPEPSPLCLFRGGKSDKIINKMEREKMMKTFEYTAVVWKEKKGFVSKCPELGVASCGDTFEEAVGNLKEAVELYIENAKELNLMEDIEESLTVKEKFTGSFELVV